MAKYNIVEKKDKLGEYKFRLSDALLDELSQKIFQIIRVQEKYLDKDYKAQTLADEIGTNIRYISAVMGVRYGMNYSMYVNKFRIEKAQQLLRDKRYANSTMEEIALLTGFANRQSFYSAFYRIEGITPKEYMRQNTNPRK